MSDDTKVACSGTVKKDDRCVECGGLLYYRVDHEENILDKFCGNIGCGQAFRPPALPDDYEGMERDE